MPVVRILDQRIARLERSIIRSETADKPAARFGHETVGDLEIIWVNGKAGTGPRMIHGIATTGRIVHAGTKNAASKDPRGCFARLPIPLKSEHAAGQIGEVVYLRKSPQEVYIRAVLFDSIAALQAWQLINSGEVRALSVAIDRMVPVGKGWRDGLDAVVDGVAYMKSVWRRFIQWPPRRRVARGGRSRPSVPRGLLQVIKKRGPRGVVENLLDGGTPTAWGSRTELREIPKTFLGT